MELGGAFGPIQVISNFIYLISAAITNNFRANCTRFVLCRTPRGEERLTATIYPIYVW